MKNRRVVGCVSLLVVSCAALFLIIAVYAVFGGRRLLERRRVQEGPPSILVHSPHDGDTYESGTVITASAVATGTNSISRVELWLDGEKFDAQYPESSESAGAINLPARFDVQVEHGPHMISWRAVDSTGLVGQSLPITIFGTPAAADKGVVEDIVVGDGATVVDIAEAHNVDPDQIRTLNPGLDEGPIPDGTKVNVPDPNAKGGGEVPPDIIQPDPLPVIPPGTPMLEVAATAIDFPINLSAFLGALPKAPDYLKAGFEDCTVRLFWRDNADNEMHFDIWMQPLGGPPRIIAKLNGSPLTGGAWYEFDSPAFGIYSFWIEAVNGVGKQSSEIEWVAVNDAECRHRLASHLEIEAVSMELFAVNWNKVYCYLSLQERPEQRIPQDDSQFFAYNGEGRWNISEWAGGKHKILIPTPPNGVVSMEGECFAWLGGDGPNSLGTFHEIVPEEGWDGSERLIQTDFYELVYRIHPFGPEESQGTFTYLDPTLDRPYDLGVEPLRTSTDPFTAADFGRYATLFWKWDGFEDDITNFTVWTNGDFFSVVAPNLRERTFILPSTCGVTYIFQVGASSNEARSHYSDSATYIQPPCPVMAEVQFLTAYSSVTDDTNCYFPDMSSCFSYTANSCHDLGIYYEIWASAAEYVVLEEWNSNFAFFPYRCGIEYTFSPHLEATPDTIIVSIDPDDPKLRFGTEFREEDDGPDDTFGVTGTMIEYEYEEWPEIDLIYTLTAPLQDATADMEVKVRVKGFYYPGP